jgi:hypothetical protein
MRPLTLALDDGGCHKVEWLLPWHSASDDPDQVAGMERELQCELSPGHPLYGMPVKTLARRQDCDDVLFAVQDGTGRVAVVHLTWTQSPPDCPPWPHTTLFPNLETWEVEAMHSDAAEWKGDDYQ